MRLRFAAIVCLAVGSPTACTFDTDGFGATPCAPRCEGDRLIACDADEPTATPTTERCVYGCVDDGAPHCGQLVPSNGGALDDLDGVTAALDVPAGARVHVDTDTGAIAVDGGGAARAAGEGLVDGIAFLRLGAERAVLAVDAVTIAGGGVLRLDGTRALVLLSRRDVVVHGLVDVSGGCVVNGAFARSCAGPGGGAGATSEAEKAKGCAPGGNGAYTPVLFDEPGAGGGGGGQDGAQGGNNNGGAGGDADRTCPGPSLVPLLGGSGGGASRDDDGGGGGGGLQITSLTAIRIEAVAESDAAAIHAGGAGGQVSIGDDGGGGGGAGGGVLLEAPQVSLRRGRLLANGGGGGAGRRPDAAAGTAPPMNGDGEHGHAGDQTPARGGAGRGDRSEGGGGSGGAGTTPPGRGGGGVDGGGGGGGGAGIIRIVAPAGAVVEIDALVSPPFTRGDLTLE